MEHPIKICPTCHQQVPDYPFRVGDKVRHDNGNVGTVDHVGASVDVQFDGYRGSFDHGWFKAYKLEKIN